MLNYCYVCHKKINFEITWSTFFLPKETKKMCYRCKRQIQKIPSLNCIRCSRPLAKNEICLDCQRWSRYLKNDPLTFNVSLLKYNDFLQEIVSRWKYRGDYVIIEVFQQDFLHLFHKVFSKQKNPIIVPIPLSAQRIQERGFNQAEQLARWLPGRIVHAFSRITSEKQAKKSRFERIRRKNPFQLNKKINQPVILVDDLYTTGSTLRQAATLLKENSCPTVYSYTLIRG